MSLLLPLLPPVYSQHHVQNDSVHIGQVMSLCSKPFSNSQLIQSKSQSPSMTHRPTYLLPLHSHPSNFLSLMLAPWLTWLQPHWSPHYSLLPELLPDIKMACFLTSFSSVLEHHLLREDHPSQPSKIAIPSSTFPLLSSFNQQTIRFT